MLIRRHPIGIASLAVSLVSAAIIGGFSQTSNELAVGHSVLKSWKAKLPAERTITSKDGRTTTGTVLSAENGAVQFRRASDGKEFSIPLDTLSDKDREWLNGPKIETGLKQANLEIVTKESPYEIELTLYDESGRKGGNASIKKGDALNVLRETNEFMVIEYHELQAIFARPANGEATVKCRAWPKGRLLHESGYVLPAVTQLKMLQQRDPLFLADLERIQNGYISSLRNYSYRIDPPLKIIDEIVPKPIGTEETVSLRENFQKAGVVPRKQTGNTCALYALHHICEYYQKIGKLPNYSFEKFKSLADADHADLWARYPNSRMGREQSYFRDKLIQILGKNFTSNLVVGHYSDPEFIKHEIRCGRPVLGGTSIGNMPHAIVVVGFRTKNEATPENFTLKTTEWEILDSNGPGYRWTNDVNSPEGFDIR